METRLQDGRPETVTRPPAGTRLCLIDEIADPGAKGFTFGAGRNRFEMFLVRRGEAITAYENACPHQGATLETFTDQFLTLDRSEIVCSLHGARFRIADGLCTDGPCLGKALTPLPIAIADRAIFIA
ncbi:MAG: Rieske 2Fe-2S domain-containing protein [Alphaproteobacteria bacterium]|nr:Rieske 2Fe-2S domain-containing protein [Alphaproteobacteria bacterium]